VQNLEVIILEVEIMNEINYDNKIFVSIANTENGEVDEETIF
jgi:hypothetical protein